LNASDGAGFIGSWNLDLGIDTVHESLYLIRGNELDSLESLPDFSENRSCVKSLPRHGSEREAATRLLDAPAGRRRAPPSNGCCWSVIAVRGYMGAE
jgi:hypothetical protein